MRRHPNVASSFLRVLMVGRSYVKTNYRIVSRDCGGGRCTAIEEALTHDNAMDTLAGVDLVVDASDNPRTRYLVNDACVLSGTPLVGCRIFFFLCSILVLPLLLHAVTC